ncbi:MAG: phospho-N-acetylmuramoyl-pentapeptide-transferase [Candidatus Marinamargulisbacteria bacterium]
MIWLGWFLGMLVTYKWAIRWFHAQQLNQPIYEDSPKQHQKKMGTPTMGGVVLFIGFLLGMLVLRSWSFEIYWVVVVSGAFGAIGWIDDILAITKKKNRGLSARVKFACQVMVAGIAVGWLCGVNSGVSLGLATVFIFLLVGTSNATNLTDGLDGLLSSTMLVSLMGVCWVFFQQQMHAEQAMVLVMMGTIVCFLIFNWYPAKLFMGDAGSLMLGAFLAASMIISGHWLMLIGLGAIYVIETLSVIIQVLWYKRTQQRVFLMAPLHHHFELMGMTDRGVVALFVVIQGILTWVQLI